MSHAYLRMFRSLPKKKKRKRPEPVPIKVYADGREVCNLKTVEGAEEYHRRKWVMWERQGKRCCLEGFISECPGALRRMDCTFEHEAGKGMGGSRHDDRIEVDGVWVNGAAHFICNGLKGSRRMDYNPAIQARMRVT